MRSIQRITFIFICLSLGLRAGAQNLKSSSLTTVAPKKNVSVISPVIDQLYFIRSDQPAFGDDEHSNQITSVGLHADQKSRNWAVDAKWFYSVQEDWHYFNVPELSYSIRTESVAFTFGRSLRSWSKADEFWQTGLWQPVFAWDGFQPTQQGLTGLFIDSQISAGQKVHFLMSGIFVPSMGAWPQEKDGRIVSKNPWVRSSPPVGKLWDVSTPIRATIDEPEFSEVVFQPSVALAYEKKWSENLQTQLSYAYKPINQTRQEYEFYVTSLPGENEIDVTVHPQFPYEHILTAEQTVQVSDWDLLLAYTYDEPLPEKARPERITQDIVTTMNLSLIARKNWDVHSPELGQFYVGAVKVWSDRPQDIGDQAPTQTQFMDRSIYSLGARVGSQNLIYKKKTSSLFSKIESTYDFNQRAAMFGLGLEYSPTRQLMISSNLNLIGAVSDSSRNGEFENGFMRWFKANDNVGVQVKYGF